MRKGWDVTIVAADTAHPSGSRMPRQNSPIEVIDGVQYRWVRTPQYQKSRGVRRLFNMLWFSAAVVMPRTCRELNKPDVIVGSTVHPFAAWSAARVARRMHVPFVFEIRDLWPETLVQVGNISRNHILVRILGGLEKYLVGASTAIIATMPNAVDYLSGIGVPRSKVHWISNGVDTDRFQCRQRCEREQFSFMYFGSLGAANGVSLIVDGFAKAAADSNRPLRLSIVGDGEQREKLEGLVARLRIAHLVTFVGAVPRNQIPDLCVEIDAFVAVTLPLPLYKYGISLNKLFEYLAAGRPILFGGFEGGNPIASSPGVVLVDPTPLALSTGFLEVSSLASETKRSMARENRLLAEREFSFDALGQRLADLLDGVAKTRS